jgi:hypothetical protein
MTPNRSEIEE